MTLRKVGRSVLAAVALMCIAAATYAQVPVSQHVVLVIDENSSYSDVMANMPWLVGEGYSNGYATNYKSDNGGSLLDYLWLGSGSFESAANCTLPPGTHDFNCNGNDCYYPNTNTTDPITDDNIFRELNNAGISWKVYAQSYAAGGNPYHAGQCEWDGLLPTGQRSDIQRYSQQCRRIGFKNRRPLATDYRPEQRSPSPLHDHRA